MQVLVDRLAGRDEEDGYVARHQGQAPEIDSSVFVNGKDIHPGQLLDVKITDYQAYDLVGELPRKKSRSLRVVTV
jgi:tRNA A37 methylthiotransferase MiaB